MKPPPPWLRWLTYRRVGLITAGAVIVGLGVIAMRRDPTHGAGVSPFFGVRRRRRRIR